MDALGLKRQILATGAVAVGFAPLREVAAEVMDEYAKWLAAEKHGAMGYLANHIDIRRNPALLLGGGDDPRPGGTVISVAFPYFAGNPYHAGKLKIARYALGDDYHEVLRRRLRHIADMITSESGFEARICVDSAPILERYWAVESGIGFIGRNHQLIVPGCGSHLFLAEIVTRLCLPHDSPSTGSCPAGCYRCVRACPGHVLTADKIRGFDSRKCHSYLTIEYRGAFSADFALRRNRLYGCDLCLEACPMAQPEEGTGCLPEFLPREKLLDLTAEQVVTLTSEGFLSLFTHSPIKRVKLAGLIRNANFSC